MSTFGEVRAMTVATIQELRAGTMDVSRGMAIAANVKVLNDNIQAEVAVTKLAIATEKSAYRFGEVMRMGTAKVAEQLPALTVKGPTE